MLTTVCLFCLFGLILYIPSTIFQLNRDMSSWVEPVLSYNKCVLLKDPNAVTPVRFKLGALGLESSILPLCHCAPLLTIGILQVNRFEIGAECST